LPFASNLVEADLTKDAEAKEAANFRAKLLGLMYGGLLEEWFRRKGYEVKKRDARNGYTLAKSFR